MTPLELVLGRLQGIKRCGDGYTARCPAHNDRRNSLSVGEGDEGRVLLHCHAGCSIDMIVQALELEVKDLHQNLAGKRRRSAAPITVDDLAVAKRLPADFLRSLGLDDRPDGVVVSYHLPSGSPASRNRLRTAILAKNGSVWLFGKGKIVPYGLSRLKDAQDAGYLIVVEGESDCWTLWHHGFPALGIPGATMTSKLEREYLDGIDRLYVVQEPDEAAKRFCSGISRQLTQPLWAGRAFRVQLEGAEDVNALHLQNPKEFERVFRHALDSAELLPASADEPCGRFDGNTGRLLKECGVVDLQDSATPEAIESSLRRLVDRLSGADDLQVAMVRQVTKEQLSALDIRGSASLVDAAFKLLDRSEGEGPCLVQDEQPWDDAVDGIAVIDSIITVIRRHVAMPDHFADAVALWVLHTFAFDASYVSPTLVIYSPEKRCGKTTLLEIVEAAAAKTLLASNITPAALFRTIEKFGPTLLIDEGDTFIKLRDEFRGILNASHYRTTARVIRTVGDNNDPYPFSTWCPKAISLIGRLHGTLEDRSIRIPMKRRAPGEKVERLRRHRIHLDLSDLRRKAARWAADELEVLRVADPPDLDGLHDRAQDNWRPLLAIADRLGGEWPERARAAAQEIEGCTDETNSSHRTQLLADIRLVFAELRREFVSSEELVEHLTSRDDRPWGEWRHGKPLTKIGLSRLLAPFGVSSREKRIEGKKTRGYALEDFADSFFRYLPPESGQQDIPCKNNDLEDNPSRDTVGTVSTRVETDQQQKGCSLDSESGRPDSVPTQRRFESGQGEESAEGEREGFDL